MLTSHNYGNPVLPHKKNNHALVNVCHHYEKESKWWDSNVLEIITLKIQNL